MGTIKKTETLKIIGIMQKYGITCVLLSLSKILYENKLRG